MKQGNWNYIKEKIQEEDNNIFEGFNKTNLNDYEKKIIFNYLCSNITYDYIAYIDILLKIVRSKEEVDKYIKEKRITDPRLIRLIYIRYEIKDYIKRRNPVEELLNTIDNHEGLCNSISQYYKLLLEYNDIYSVCVICDNLSHRNHQINLVYSKDNDIFGQLLLPENNMRIQGGKIVDYVSNASQKDENGKDIMQKAVESVKRKEDRPRRFENNKDNKDNRFNKFGNKKNFDNRNKSVRNDSKVERNVETKKEERVTVKEEAKVEKKDLSTLTVSELRDMAKEKDIKGYSTMKKAELIEVLK